MKLLIVEDNPAIRRLLRRMLAYLAEEISDCRNGGEVLDAYTRFQPDWVLMDIEMTEMDGIGATRQLIAASPEAKVITGPTTTTGCCGAPRSKPERADTCSRMICSNRALC